MKTLFNTLMLAAALTLVWGCSSDDKADTIGSAFTGGQAPRWAVDWHDSQERPKLEPPTPSFYENKMIMMLRLQDELVPYSTEEDLMAVFTDTGYECRALSQRSGKAGAIYFVLNVYGNSTGEPETFNLLYYSGGLHALFRLSGENTFLNEMNVGTDGDLVIDLLQGQTKYPLRTELTVSVASGGDIAVNVEADLVGAFVDGECRGTGRPGVPFSVYYREGEQVQLRYYNSGKGGIYTQTEPLALTQKAQTITFTP